MSSPFSSSGFLRLNVLLRTTRGGQGPVPKTHTCHTYPARLALATPGLTGQKATERYQLTKLADAWHK